jgi:hypothetical protein
MVKPTLSLRHQVLIAAAAAAVLGPRVRVAAIRRTGWTQLRPGHQPVPRTAVRRAIQVHIRTARRERIRETANLD